MSDSFAACVGSILSADIAVPEHEREVAFYVRVLTTGKNPLWREDLMNSQGIPIIGLGKRTDAYANLPLQWMPHIQVADVATSVARTTDLGGSVLMHDQGEDGTSRWAVLRDPNGAAFGIVPVVPAEALPAGEAATARTGHIAWLDLTVPNATETCNFYKEVVGWTVQEVAMSDPDGEYADYNMLNAEGKPAAGVCHARGVNQDIPLAWMIYLPVDDLPESLGRVETAGGKIIASNAIDGKNGYAVIQDPVGVHIAVSAG